MTAISGQVLCERRLIVSELRNLAKAIGFTAVGWLVATGADAIWKGSEPLPGPKLLIAMAVGMSLGLVMRWNRHRDRGERS